MLFELLEVDSDVLTLTEYVVEDVVFGKSIHETDTFAGVVPCSLSNGMHETLLHCTFPSEVLYPINVELRYTRNTVFHCASQLIIHCNTILLLDLLGVMLMLSTDISVGDNTAGKEYVVCWVYTTV